jgi:hypothetical protein
VVLQRVRGRIRLRVESREGNRMQAPMGLLAGKVQAWLQDVNNDGVLDLIVRTKRNGRTLVRQFDGTTLTALG